MKNKVLDLGLCLYDMEKKELSTKQNQIVHITPVEQLLLSVLGQKAGQVFFAREAGRNFRGRTKPALHRCSNHPSAQKNRKDSKNPRYLQTVRGKGYMLLPE